MKSSSDPVSAEPNRHSPDPPGPVFGLNAFVERAAERLQQGTLEPIHVAGARGAGTPLLALSLAKRLDELVVYVAPDADGAEAAARDLRHLIGDPSVGWPQLPSAARRVRVLLPSESSPYDQVHPDRRAAMARLGYQIDVVPQPVNFFTNTVVQPDGALLSPPNPVPSGAFVELAARLDLICVVSSCPFDLPIPGWTINAPGGPTELIVEVR